MSENDFSLPQPDRAGSSRCDGVADASGSADWPLPRWRRNGTDRGEGNASSSASDPTALRPPVTPHSRPPVEATPGVLVPNSTHTHVTSADVVAGHIGELRLETRKRDVLEGMERDRQEILDQPFVLEAQWTEPWEQALDSTTRQLRQRVLIVVASRSLGSTTFALQLLARHTDAPTTVVKLDADWRAPSRGRLPLDKQHAYQVDLKDKTTDQLSVDFLDSLTRHAEDLAACHSYLVLTVAKELWHDHYLTPRGGVQVVYLKEPPDAQRVVEAHLEFLGYKQLISHIPSLDQAIVPLRGLDAVEAVRAAAKTIAVWAEYTRQQADLSLAASHSAPQEPPTRFADRLATALSDWREKLDCLFGEVVAVRGVSDSSLTLEDRCLLLSLAVRQSAPMTEVATAAGKLQSLMTADQGKATTATLVQTVFAGRGLRRRIHDVGARVDSYDTVIFDQPSYGRAILTYVWDNYEVMRKPLLIWLTQTGDGPTPGKPVVDALADLVLRHGSTDHLDILGSIARSENPELLSAVMLRAVQDEHVGRLAWATLYRWAGQSDYASAVVSTCHRVLQNPSTSQSAAKMAIVRLRRIAHKIDGSTTRAGILQVFRDLAEQPTGTAMLIAEAAAWQASRASHKSGSLAFMALMSKDHDGMPWLMSDTAAGIDVDQALQDLLSDTSTAQEVIAHLARWIRAYATDTTSYVRLRDRLVRVLRGHNMFHAYWDFIQSLATVPITVQGINVAEDFHRHLIDPRLRPVFSIKEGLV